MKRAIGLLMLVIVTLAVQNNFPSLQLVVLLLPLLIVVALSVYHSPNDHVLAVVGVCLLYASLSGAFVYSAGVGFVALGFVWLTARWQLSLLWTGAGLTLATQLRFVAISDSLSSLVAFSFAVQLLVILTVSSKLLKGGGHARV